MKNDATLNLSVPDPCLSNPCRNGGTCINQGESYYCDCPEKYTGPTCSEREYSSHFAHSILTVLFTCAVRKCVGYA